MTTINDRIGSQNVIRVLSNASAPPSRLANLGDVDATREDETGLVLVGADDTATYGDSIETSLK